MAVMFVSKDNTINLGIHVCTCGHHTVDLDMHVCTCGHSIL